MWHPQTHFWRVQKHVKNPVPSEQANDGLVIYSNISRNLVVFLVIIHVHAHSGLSYLYHHLFAFHFLNLPQQSFQRQRVPNHLSLPFISLFTIPPPSIRYSSLLFSLALWLTVRGKAVWHIWSCSTATEHIVIYYIVMCTFSFNFVTTYRLVSQLLNSAIQKRWLSDASGDIFRYIEIKIWMERHILIKSIIFVSWCFTYVCVCVSSSVVGGRVGCTQGASKRNSISRSSDISMKRQRTIK